MTLKQKNLKLKNMLIISKVTLALIAFAAAFVIYNDFSINTIGFYLLVLSAVAVYCILNSANCSYYQKINTKENQKTIKEFNLQYKLEKLLIVILAVSIVNIIEINTIPLILSATGAYYLLSAYINTFQKI